MTECSFGQLINATLHENDVIGFSCKMAESANEDRRDPNFYVAGSVSQNDATPSVIMRGRRGRGMRESATSGLLPKTYTLPCTSNNTPYRACLVCVALSRPQPSRKNLPQTENTFCEPKPFMRNVHTSLQELGVSEDRIRYEYFWPKEDFVAGSV